MLRDEAMRLAQRQVEASCNAQEHIDRAKQNCELILKMMYQLVDWDVIVEWGDEVDDLSKDETPAVKSAQQE